MKGLELGPGSSPIKGFISMDIVERKGVDYVGDVSKRLPFADGEFDVVYASHVLEHIAWYDVQRILKDWVRVVKPGGALEIWVPDGLKICEAVVKHEHDPQLHARVPDKWLRQNKDSDPCTWANGRIFYGDSGTGAARQASFHKSMFTPRYLEKVLRQAGLVQVHRLAKPRGVDHGWINLGMGGVRP